MEMDLTTQAVEAAKAAEFARAEEARLRSEGKNVASQDGSTAEAGEEAPADEDEDAEADEADESEDEEADAELHAVAPEEPEEGNGE